MKINGDTVKSASFDHDRRREWIKRDISRVDDGDSTLRREPELAVARLNTRRLGASVAFWIEQAIALAVRDGRHSPCLSLGEVVELLLAHSIDPLIRAEPEIAPLVFQNLKGTVAEETILHRAT